MDIDSKAPVKVTIMNHLVEIQYMEKMNHSCKIKKVDADHYCLLETGEIKEFDHGESRKDSYCSLKRTFKHLRYLINNNFTGSGNELHMTLTYRQNMTDADKLYSDLKKFVMRLRYQFKDETTIDYLAVVEPQGRGAWHVHFLARFNNLEKVYIENVKLSDLWGHGFVKIRSLDAVDNIGAYLSAYLGDVEATEENVLELILKGETSREIKEVKGKKIIKGGRLHMYPPGMNLYRKSKGIREPERLGMKYEKAKKIVGSAKPTFEKTYEIETDEFSNTIMFEQYNFRRKV